MLGSLRKFLKFQVQNMRKMAGHVCFHCSDLYVFFYTDCERKGGESLFAYRFSCPGVMVLKAGFCVNFSLCSNILGSAYLFLSGAEFLL